ncbi:MAG: protease inhibitor I42 family protein [Clostridiales bacterium]|nr:protease inhibitor I42 family protein [Clostridiales bacterium]
MKKIVSIVLILMMMTGVFADTAVPTLYSELPFELSQEGDIFTIILDENGSTGYTWSYVVNKEDHVKFISDEYVSKSNIPGAPGKHHFTFEVLADGVSTIDFKHHRSFEENSTIDTIDVLVYKNGEKVFVEENGIVTINEPVLISEPIKSGVVVSEKMLEMDTAIQTIDGVTMVPVAETLRALGYDVKWVSETQSIEISRNAQWTSITIGKNAYFKNRMAARPLSAAPVIYNDRAMVPAEFFNVILDLGIQVEEGQIEFNEYGMSAYSGYIKEIKINDKGVVSLFLTYEEGAEMVDVVIHTSNETTFVQGSIKVGDQINALTSMATTMSIPPQTAGYIIY